MTSFTGRFRLNASQVPSSSRSPLVSPLNPTANFTFQAFQSALPSPPAGSFEYDKIHSNYPWSWDSWSAFEAWKTSEERKYCIEFRLVNNYPGLPEFERKLRFVCSRAGTGGAKAYTKLHPDWKRKVPSKRTDCKCTLMVKQYPGMPIEAYVRLCSFA
jgi:hypothetical protein